MSKIAKMKKRFYLFLIHVKKNSSMGQQTLEFIVSQIQHQKPQKARFGSSHHHRLEQED